MCAEKPELAGALDEYGASVANTGAKAEATDFANVASALNAPPTPV